MGILIIVGQLILSLSILIVLHEMGHFLPAKWFGTRVEKFFLFFDPWFELFSIERGGTRYGIGWLPLGGYVKISGMVDESFDTEALAEEPKEWEFRSKPAWQRLIIMLGGVTVNFFLGFLIFAMTLFTWGDEYLPTMNAKYGVAVDSVGTDLGLQDGDFVLGTETMEFERVSSALLRQELIINDAREIRVNRGGAEQTLRVTDEQAKALSKEVTKGYRIYRERVPFVIAEMDDDSPAKKAGLEVDDKIIALNSQPTPYFMDFVRAIKGKKNEEITVTIERGNQQQVVQVTTNDDAKIAASPYGGDRYFDYATVEYGFLESFPAGVDRGWDFLTNQVRAFGQIGKGKLDASDSLGSFISIGKLFGTTWDWQRFWELTAMLSLLLAFINMLPVPGLDGGHVMFLLYEVITGRKPSDVFVERATLVGFILLVILMVYAIGLDISRLF